MANVAIKGHETRGKEVIQLLEMLGGKNKYQIDAIREYYVYFVDKDGIIRLLQINQLLPEQYIVFTLEEFLEKFPYKVGDEVIAYAEGCLTKFTIQDIRWNYELNKVEYKICSSWLDASLIMQRFKEQETIDKTKFPYEIGTRVSVKGTYFDKLATIVGLSYNSSACMQYEIQFDGEDVVVHYPTHLMTPIITEQSMEERDEKTVKHVFNANVISFDIAQKDKYELDLQGKFEVVLREGKYYVERIKPQYPKDYEGCCKVLGIRSDWHLTLELDTPATHDLSVTKEFDYVAKLESLRKLLICRDAYWKLAGEQMGLANPWEPDYSEEDYEQGCPIKYVIYYTGTHIRKERKCTPSYVLSFPTKEMLVSFYENFKDLINDCKELL